MEKITRESYIEREFSKWKENYVIEFGQEFDLKALLDLQYQYENTPADHIKAKRDIIENIQKVRSGLSLKKKPNVYKGGFNIIVVAYNVNELLTAHKMFQSMMDIEGIHSDYRINYPSIEGIHSDYRINYPRRNFSYIKTKNFNIKFIQFNPDYLDSLKGLRADYIINLTGNNKVNELIQINTK